MALTKDRRRSAYVGVFLTLFGVGSLFYGSLLIPPIAATRDHLVGGLMLVFFGFMLALFSMAIFVLPALWDYLEDLTD